MDKRDVITADVPAAPSDAASIDVYARIVSQSTEVCSHPNRETPHPATYVQYSRGGTDVHHVLKATGIADRTVEKGTVIGKVVAPEAD